MKLYKKRGNKNYKEKRLIQEIESALTNKMESNPNIENEIVPATNISELQKMHSKYVGVEEAEYIEVKNDSTNEKSQMIKKETEEIEDIQDFEVVEEKPSSNSSSTFIDPFNREEPIVRDYVLGDESMRKNVMSSEQKSQTVFEEPTSFDEAFLIPEDDDDNLNDSEKQPSKKDKSSSSQPKQKESLNPNFEDMSSGKQKKSTEKFAKYIVEAVSVATEKGFVWFANKDINDSKLAEYEMSDGLDLSILVTLDTGQDVTVKQFFQSQCSQAESLSKWTPEQKEDLTNALAAVLLEKGIAPTPSQELILVAATIIGGQAMTLMTLKSQTNSLLEQLKNMDNGRQEYETTYSEPPQKEEPIEDKEVSIEDLDIETKSNIESEIVLEPIADNLTEEELLISNKSIQTKE